MEVLDLSKQATKQTVPGGTVVLLQGAECKSLNILHAGMVEVLFSEDPELSSAPESLIEKSLRIGLVKGEALVGLSAIASETNTYTISMRAVSECTVSIRPMARDELISQIHKDNFLNFKILRDLCTRVESAVYLYTNYKYLWHKYASIADSIALGMPGEAVSVYDAKERSSSSAQEYSGYLKAMVKDVDRTLPEAWDYNLFLGNLQDSLKLYDDHDQMRIEDLIDHPQFIFIKRLVQKNDKILTALFAKDEPLNQYIFVFLSRTIASLLKANIAISREIKELMDIIYSDTGWAVQVISGSRNDNPQKKNFLHFLSKFSWRCRKDTMTLLGKDLFTEYKVFSALKRYQNFILPEEEAGTAENSAVLRTEDVKKRLAKFRGLLVRILDFSGMSDEFKEEFKALMDKLAATEKKHDGDKAVQKLRDDISVRYWQLYENCFLKVIDSDLKGFIPGIMLHFGVVDERFLTEEELLVIDRFYAGNLFIDEEIPVMTLPYYLEKIYKSEVAPSMTEMGDLFDSVLKRQDKMTKKEKAETYMYEDTPEDKVRFEIRQIAMELYRMLYGNKKKALPFLCSESTMGNVKRFFIDPELFAETVRKYKKRDYSLFYREVLFKHKLGSDFIQKDVVPNFVFYPVFGSRAVMWQEMEGNRKHTPGRLFFPLFFSEKLVETILAQLAYFRWELQKSIAGYKWTDPVEGGLVGVYYDYIRYFKKNPNITPEAKNRLEEFVKKTKSDKDRFAQEYLQWVEFEFEGKLRLNNYVRDLFYRFCPFPQDKRDIMAQKPNFKTMENKFQNRREKEILKIKSKLIKFEKKGIPVPVEILNYLHFLEL